MTSLNKKCCPVCYSEILKDCCNKFCSCHQEKKCDCFDTKYEGSANWHPTEHREGCPLATPKNSEWGYHEIERILNDFKNGATYSDSIEKIQLLLQERSKQDEANDFADRAKETVKILNEKERSKELIEKIEGMKYSEEFDDDHDLEDLGAEAIANHAYTDKFEAFRYGYNQALKSVLQKLSEQIEQK